MALFGYPLFGDVNTCYTDECIIQTARENTKQWDTAANVIVELGPYIILSIGFGCFCFCTANENQTQHYVSTRIVMTRKGTQ